MGAKEHYCETPRNWADDFYGCSYSLVETLSDGRWYAHNGEYATAVMFCPICGEKAPVSPVWEEERP